MRFIVLSRGWCGVVGLFPFDFFFFSDSFYFRNSNRMTNECKLLCFVRHFYCWHSRLDADEDDDGDCTAMSSIDLVERYRWVENVYTVLSAICFHGCRVLSLLFCWGMVMKESKGEDCVLLVYVEFVYCSRMLLAWKKSRWKDYLEFYTFDSKLTRVENLFRK